MSHCADPAALVLGAREPATLLSEPGRWIGGEDFVQRMMLADTLTYLPDDILVKMDRASMSVGLEARVPLLDHRLIEFASRMPSSMKLRGREGKWLLRQILYKYVPRSLVERPKMGFAVPIDQWLRGPLRGWAEALLNEKRLCAEGVFQPAPIRAMWTEHLSGARNWQHNLWNILMFEAWLEAGRRSGAASPALAGAAT
jgi:asparagine synthase (glutamine-hydrolysing)